MKSILLSVATVAFFSATVSANEIMVGEAAGTARPTQGVASFLQKYGLESRMRSLNVKPSVEGRCNSRSAVTGEGMVTDPQGSVSRYAMSGNIFLSHMGAVHIGGFGAQAVISRSGDEFYTKALTLNFFQQGFSRGEISGDSIIFRSGQYVYDTDKGEKAYMYAAHMEEGTSWPDFADSFVLVKDEAGRYVSAPDDYILILTEEEAEGGINELTDIICFGTNYVFTPLPEDVIQYSLPDDAEVMECQMSANSLADMGDIVIKDVTVGIKDNDIYIGGLTDYLPGSYLKGTKTGENTYTFSSHQYLGYFDEGEYPYVYEFAMVNPIYFDEDAESLFFLETPSVEMSFNAEHTMLTLEEEAGVFVCAYGDLSSWNEVYWNMMLGDMNQALTPMTPTGVSCYHSYGAPYIFFDWSSESVEGMPMDKEKLWCEVMLNGEHYVFLPEYYEGLPEATDRVYYNTSGVMNLYPGSSTTIYFKEFEDNFGGIRTLGIRIGYESADGIVYTDVVYADGFEPFEDKAYIPGEASGIVYYKDYNDVISFKYDGKDVDGNPIPERLLCAEIFMDGKPIVFEDGKYFFRGGEDVTMIGLSEHALNYSSSIVSHYGDTYEISLWGHDALPEFKTLAVRLVGTGNGIITYGAESEIDLLRNAVPAAPWDVAYDKDRGVLKFGSLPIAEGGAGLAPWKYGYEVYVDGDLYEFKASLYDLDENVIVVPYDGFEYNYDFYHYSQTIYAETDWSVIGKNVVMEITMKEEGLDIRKIGVRSVYTDADGATSYSAIVNSDGSIDVPTGVESIVCDGSIDYSRPVEVFTLGGSRVSDSIEGLLRGIYIVRQGGNTQKITVK